MSGSKGNHRANTVKAQGNQKSISRGGYRNTFNKLSFQRNGVTEQSLVTSKKIAAGVSPELIEGVKMK
jgi:hypothetical protein